MSSLEQQARGILHRCGVRGAYQYSSGDVVELANLIERVAELESELAEWRGLHAAMVAGQSWPCPYSQDVAMVAWAIEHQRLRAEKAEARAKGLESLLRGEDAP